MKTFLIRTIACILAVSVATPDAVEGQVAAPPASPPAAETPAPPATPVFRKEEIDQMVAPIALYPDQLLAQILMASTYPLEIVQASRWLKDPKNAKLKGEQLATALEPQTWDPSVKSLVPFPQVLNMMNEKLDWTQRLGDAFLAQQADVMASVQRLRQQAQSSGSLKSTEQQKVVVEPQSQAIVIEPANPQVVYVPSYNPSVVYGTWAYPAYPPVYYPPPAAYYPVASSFVSGMAFATGAAVVGSLWGWGSANWGHGDVNINTNRYNNINTANIRSGRANQLASSSNTWRHDSSHRGGVAYRDAGTRQAYQRGGAGQAAANRNYRGYDGNARGAGQGTSRPPGDRAATAPRQGGTSAARSPGAGQGAGRQPGASAQGTRQFSGQSQQPSAFQGMGSGSDTRAQSDRGRASRQSAAGASGFSGGSRAGGGARGGGGGGRGGGRR